MSLKNYVPAFLTCCKFGVVFVNIPLPFQPLRSIPEAFPPRQSFCASLLPYGYALSSHSHSLNLALVIFLNNLPNSMLFSGELKSDRVSHVLVTSGAPRYPYEC